MALGALDHPGSVLWVESFPASEGALCPFDSSALKRDSVLITLKHGHGFRFDVPQIKHLNHTPLDLVRLIPNCH